MNKAKVPVKKRKKDIFEKACFMVVLNSKCVAFSSGITGYKTFQCQAMSLFYTEALLVATSCTR